MNLVKAALVLLVDLVEEEGLLPAEVGELDVHPAGDGAREVALGLGVAHEHDLRVRFLRGEELAELALQLSLIHI